MVRECMVIFDRITDIGTINDVISPKICNISLTELQIKSIIKQVLLGLKFLAHNKIPCTNIRADRIYLKMTGKCKINFSWIDQYAFDRDLCTSKIPKSYWLAPEQMEQFATSIPRMESVIWSLGITAIEMANGDPPGKDKWNYMQYIFMMKHENAPIPKLENNDNTEWSDEFKDFVSLCLKREAKDRASIDELLRHKWVKDAYIGSGFYDLYRIANTALPFIEKHREREEKKWMQDLDSMSEVYYDSF